MTEAADRSATPLPATSWWFEALSDTTRAITALTRAAAGAGDLDEVLQAVGEHAVTSVPAADIVSVTVIDGAEAVTAAITDRDFLDLDRHQYASGEGPCLVAARTGRVVRATLAEATGRWPSFADAGRAAHLGGVLSAPLSLGGGRTGSVNCFGFAAEGFGEADAHLLRVYTAGAEAVVHGALRDFGHVRSAAQVTEALERRCVIEQAKGVLMAVHAVDSKGAFELLVARSQEENTKVWLLARQLVDQVSGNRPGR
ncbi:GAF and ANTAR domain-containing protein [Actinosynnema sp. NPDC023587]|uniref:GAF and ANTAR domain-containing protein n=1 Tax=Actinosynnema sp. NPDC023587 TaxID=3154695 RepID=UPI0033EF145A